MLEAIDWAEGSVVVSVHGDAETRRTALCPVAEYPEYDPAPQPKEQVTSQRLAFTQAERQNEPEAKAKHSPDQYKSPVQVLHVANNITEVSNAP